MFQKWSVFASRDVKLKLTHADGCVVASGPTFASGIFKNKPSACCHSPPFSHALIPAFFTSAHSVSTSWPSHDTLVVHASQSMQCDHLYIGIWSASKPSKIWRLRFPSISAIRLVTAHRAKVLESDVCEARLSVDFECPSIIGLYFSGLEFQFASGIRPGFRASTQQKAFLHGRALKKREMFGPAS